jgi:hypothetical protein
MASQREQARQREHAYQVDHADDKNITYGWYVPMSIREITIIPFTSHHSMMNGHDVEFSSILTSHYMEKNSHRDFRAADIRLFAKMLPSPPATLIPLVSP